MQIPARRIRILYLEHEHCGAIMSDLVHPELSYKINGLCFKVHNDLGRFRNERSYADAFELLLKEEHMRYEREPRLSPSFGSEKRAVMCRISSLKV